jgi:CheY-like chemotaxis protein
MRSCSQGLRILVVDDNVDAAETLELILRLAGHEVVVAFDGIEALAMFAEFQPDVAILDLGLPGIDGFEVALRVRADERFRSIPLIAHSGYSLPSHRERSRAVGFTHHLAKPIDMNQLRAILAEIAPRK